MLGVFAEFERATIIDGVHPRRERKAAKAAGAVAPFPTATTSTATSLS